MLLFGASGKPLTFCERLLARKVNEVNRCLRVTRDRALHGRAFGFVRPDPRSRGGLNSAAYVDVEVGRGYVPISEACARRESFKR
jgi:hypothetical protein